MECLFESLGSNTINTTIGDLIAALTDIAMESGSTEQEGYQITSLALEDILRIGE